MLWCFLVPAAIFAGLGLTALTLDVRALRPPRVSPRHVLRGCMAGSLLLIAGGLVALTAAVQSWPL